MNRFIIILLGMYCGIANAQSFVLPTYKIDPESKADVGTTFKPDSKFLSNNPDFLTNGKYLLANIKKDKYGNLIQDTVLSSNQYPAFVCNSTPAITSTSRFICYLTLAPYNISGADKSAETRQKEAMQTDCDKRNDRVIVFPTFANAVNSYFPNLNYTNYYATTKFGKYFTAENSLRANDVLLEFTIDEMKVLVKNNTDPSYIKYSLTVKDITGRTIHVFRQACLLNIKAKYFTYEICKTTMQAALSSLLNQYFMDATAAKDTRYYTNAVGIKSQTDKNYLTIINKKAALESLQEDKAKQMCVLKGIERSLKSHGVTGLDLSQVNFTMNTPDPMLNAAATSIATGAAVIGSSIAAAVIAAEIAALKRKLKEEMANNRALLRKEADLLGEIDNLIAQQQTVNSYAPPPNESNEPAAKVSENFWEEQKTTKPNNKPSNNATNRNLKPAPDTRSFNFDQENTSPKPATNYSNKPKTEPAKPKSNDNYWDETEKK